MEKVVNTYETMFIINAQLSDDEISTLAERFKNLIADNGTIDAFDEWGKRKLAYPIDDMPEGYYVLCNFKSEPSFPLELERIYGITDGIIRSLVLRR